MKLKTLEPARRRRLGSAPSLNECVLSLCEISRCRRAWGFPSFFNPLHPLGYQTQVLGYCHFHDVREVAQFGGVWG